MKKLHVAAAALALLLLADAAWGAVDFAQALATAQTKAGGGFLIRGRSETKNGRRLFGFYFLREGIIIEVEISALDGSVFKVKEVKRISGGGDVGEPNPPPGGGDTGIDPALVNALNARKKAKIPFNRYLELALKQVPGGEVSRIETTVRDGKLVIIIDVVVDGQTKRVTIDVSTNRVVG